jgi:fructokinase
VVIRPPGGAPRVWRGLQGIAGEWGHSSLYPGSIERDCYCGARGCVEMFLAGPAIEADYARRSGRRLGLPEIVAGRTTDAHAQEVLGGFVLAFGRALANLIDVLDPTVVVLGGGVSNLDLLYDEGVARVRAAVFSDELLTPIVRHALGDSAGVLGAALLID